MGAHIVKKGKTPDGRWTRQGLTARAGRPTPGEAYAPPPKLTDVRWEVRYRLSGRGGRIHSAGTFATRERAERRLRQVEEDLANGQIPTRGLEPRGMRVREAVIEARKDLGVTMAPNTLRNWDRGIALLGDLGEVTLAALHWRHLEAWHLANLHLKPRTRAIYFGQYRRALNRCDLDPNPAYSTNLKRARAATPPTSDDEDEGEALGCPTHAEMRALLECLERPRRRSRPSRYLPPARFMELTGVRVCELIAIRRRDVDLANGRIWIRRTKTGTGGRRYIPITRELAPLIDELDLSGTGREPLFGRGERGRRPFTENGMYKALQRASHAAGLRSTVGNHDLRHRYISRLIMANVPFPMIQLIVGHSNLTSLLRVYAHVLPNEPPEPLEPLREDLVRFFNEGRNERTT
jgi:site-specific recombinase XerC